MTLTIRQGWTEPARQVPMPADVAAVFKAACPGYRGRTYHLEPMESVRMTDTYWDGGSRSDYTVVHLASRQVKAVPDLISGGFAPHADQALKALSDVPLRDGYGVVRHSIFCGRDTGLTLYVRPDNLAPLLASAPADRRESETGPTTETVTELGGYICIRFAAKPPEATLETLRAGGWKWRSSDKTWVRSISDGARAAAETYRAAV